MLVMLVSLVTNADRLIAAIALQALDLPLDQLRFEPYAVDRLQIAVLGRAPTMLLI